MLESRGRRLGAGGREKRVLAFRHVPFEGAGRIATVLAKRHIQLDHADNKMDSVISSDRSNELGR